MEPLLKQLSALPQKLLAAPARTRILVAAALGVLALLGGLIAVGANQADTYAYVFTSLTPEDGTEAAQTLKSSGIPFRMEANGAAVAVPTARVYDARLLLAGAGIPRGGHVGFELFDKGEMGLSQFTQRVNLRRAIEGELARTVGSLEPIRSARVHLTLPETGLHREDDRDATAAVVVNLKPGETLSNKELAGIRHLVSSSVPGLKTESVSIVDGSGAMLAGENDTGANAQAWQRRTEKDMERRVVEILEPMVGAGHVLARVTAEVDDNTVDATQEQFDPDGQVVRSERTLGVSNNSTGAARQGGVAGAAANLPMQPAQAAAATPGGAVSASTQADETRNYEISKTTTRTRRQQPRMLRLSVAVLVDAPVGAPRGVEEMSRLTELARRAVGFDEARGDRLELVSNTFMAAAVVDEKSEPVAPTPWVWIAAAGAGVLLVVGLLVALVLVARRRPRDLERPLPLSLLAPGMRVSDIAAELDGEPAAALATAPLEAAPTTEAEVVLTDDQLREKARQLARDDPQRAVYLLRAWLTAERTPEEISNGR